MSSTQDRGWTLYSPSAPTEIEAPTWGEPIGVSVNEISTDGFHEGGWFLPEAQQHGWRFGVSQDRLCNGRVHAFVRTPSGEELTVVVDHRATGVSRLNVAVEPGYLGAVLVGSSHALSNRSELVQTLLASLPKLHNFVHGSSPSGDA